MLTIVTTALLIAAASTVALAGERFAYPESFANEIGDNLSPSGRSAIEYFCTTYEPKYCKDNALEKERKRRFQIIVDNHDYIERSNRQQKSFTLGLTQFADLTNDEFREMILPRQAYETKRADSSYLMKRRSNDGDKYTIPRNNYTKSVDWREKGAVTDVKNQGQCGSCYAFSATGSIEGATAIATGKLRSLSEQEVVDCDKHDHGCHGGLMDFVFDYVLTNGGLCLENEYKYKAFHGFCRARPSWLHHDVCQRHSPISGWVDVKAKDEHELTKAISIGPVSVAIYAGHRDFQLYSSGVYSNECQGQLDHGVLAVGYGATADGQKYYIVKNSWGGQWGEEGYIKMARNIDNVNGQCGIATSASYPLAETSDD